ncbi:unnamed protein product, partial [Chrysoparadoxa australica]
MSQLFDVGTQPKIYWDRQTFATFEDHVAALKKSSTLYIGNLSFYSTEVQQIRELFGLIGSVRRVIMGLDRMKRTPCGFCFVEYYSPRDALAAISFMGGSCLDERVIRVELDPGFRPGRQFGRGSSGGQV